MSDGAALQVVVPAGIDDPGRPSGGNHYDRRVIDGLRGLGREVLEHRADDLASALASVPGDAVTIVDGLLAVAAPDAITREAQRLRVVVLLHMPFAQADPELAGAERAVVTAATGVVTTSAWARDWVVRHHHVDPERVAVAPPGADPAPANRPSPAGTHLLCLAAVTRAKGQDVLFAALAEIADLDWTLTCAGALDLEPSYVGGLREIALRSGIGDRVRFTGPLAGDALDSVLGETDLLVSASRHEAYGMAVTEALARAVPVVVSDVGGHGEAVGAAGGVLVPPDDPDRLAAALRDWLTDPNERSRLRTLAARRRSALGSWHDTARLLEAAVNRMATPLVSPLTTP